MATRPTGVLKKGQIRTSGPCRLGGPQAPGVTRPSAARAPTQVRIVQRDEDRAVVEVRCPCGNITLIECRWAGDEPAPEDPSDPASQGPDPTRKEDA